LGPTSFRVRRLLAGLSVNASLLLFVVLAGVYRPGLDGRPSVTGFTLLATIILLCLIGVRKRIPVLPLGNMSTWTQFHLYMGLFSVGVYCLHVPAIIGEGRFEGGLSILFLAVAASGVYGIYVSRIVPKKLTVLEGRNHSNPLGWQRQQLARTADQLLAELQDNRSKQVLGHDLVCDLSKFFNQKPSPTCAVVPWSMRRQRLLTGLGDANRSLRQADQNLASQLAGLVRHRDNLDQHYALRLRLRVWLVLHSCLSLALLVGGLLHAAVATGVIR